MSFNSRSLDTLARVYVVLCRLLFGMLVAVTLSVATWKIIVEVPFVFSLSVFLVVGVLAGLVWIYLSAERRVNAIPLRQTTADTQRAKDCLHSCTHCGARQFGGRIFVKDSPHGDTSGCEHHCRRCGRPMRELRREGFLARR